ncbi:hypothetical protein S40293_03352 [Stachybotrys chartarum IBT 40293]|nr:hypothetical protein S40293_03352 [Stachybotrys chartarum IBT 40293]
MDPQASRNGHQRRPSDIITRIHNAALETPTSLPVLSQSQPLSQSPESTRPALYGSLGAAGPGQPSRNRPRLPHSRSQPHSRSMSQPFPALFGGKKKRQGSSIDDPPVDLDWVGNDGRITSSKQTPKAHTRSGPAGASQDFATGNCMTCSALVRWPRELKVFKCTICTTVNDLVPTSSEDRNGAVRRRDAPNATSSPSTSSSGRAMTPSVQYTRQLVTQCLRSCISKRLSKKQATPSESSQAPIDDNRLKNEPASRGYTLSLRPQNDPRGQETLQSSYTAQYIFDEPPTLRRNHVDQLSSSSLYPLPSNGITDKANESREVSQQLHHTPSSAAVEDEPKRIFKQLEDYIIACFGSFESINNAFVSHPSRYTARTGSEPVRRKPVPSRDAALPYLHARNHSLSRDHTRVSPQSAGVVCDLDPKLLLLGDFAENGTWWTGEQSSIAAPPRSLSDHGQMDNGGSAPVTGRSPQINRTELGEWYHIVCNTAEGWLGVYEDLARDPASRTTTERDLQQLEQHLLQAQEHVQRTLLKAIEMVLKRPGRPLSEPADLRFLLIAFANPLLHSETRLFRGFIQSEDGTTSTTRTPVSKAMTVPSSGLLSGQHSGIIKRIVGLISNSPSECHNQLIAWLARYQSNRFNQTKELVSGFLSYRMLRQTEKKQEVHVDITAGLIPQIQNGRSGAYLYDEIGASSSSKKPKEATKKIPYADDWQIKAASRVLALLFAANNLASVRRSEDSATDPQESHWAAIRDGVHANGQLLSTSDFYNSMIDYVDLVGDFEAWESKKGVFTFCQYPFLMSIWAKTQILEYDARRQMEMKARDAFFESIMNNKNTKQFLFLTVRRDCLVEDSLTAVSEVIGSGGEDVKKRLRIEFRGEEGIDAGGLRKEWFLLLVREVFNPDHGMFIYDEDSQCCYFNPNSFETSDQFFLVGVVMGLAIYNSTILDVALPPVAFRKLLASAPAHGAGQLGHSRPALKYTLDDLAEFRPSLARGLKQLLDFDGDVETTFALDFVIEVEKYGTTYPVPLCVGGERKPVTNNNRREYVDLYVRYVLDTSVARQFEPFKRGFYTVCGGNAFSLFRPEEIELLVRGSDEPLDISTLRAVAVYDNWGDRKPDGREPVIDWFWETFQQANTSDQRRMLLFITGSDRIPAMGAATLPIKISCLGDDCGRFPIARTCFNMLSLWRYGTKEKLEAMLWRAVRESEGFGLK